MWQRSTGILLTYDSDTLFHLDVGHFHEPPSVRVAPPLSGAASQIGGDLQNIRQTENASSARALLMELSGPADWNELSKVWRAVQAELQLPAPAIAVSGSDGMQLWFSLQAPVSVQRASAFLTQLRVRYLPGIAPGRVHLLPSDAEGPFSVQVIQSRPATGLRSLRQTLPLFSLMRHGCTSNLALTAKRICLPD